MICITNVSQQTDNATTGKPGVHPLYQWSNEWRPLPAEGFDKDDIAAQHGGYLPVLAVCEAVLKTGWRGPWSYEVRFAFSFTPLGYLMMRARYSGHKICHAMIPRFPNDGQRMHSGVTST
jgi:hypothetical protein